MAATLDSLTDEILASLHSYGLSQDRAAFLSDSVSAADIELPVNSVDGFDQGVAEIGNETVFIFAADRDSSTLSIAPDGRGYLGTTAQAHADKARITMAPTWPRYRVQEAINNAIIGTYPTLFKVASTTFDYNVVQSTYDLPGDVDGVLSVMAETIGPSREWVTLTRWSFDSDGIDGNALTLEEGGFPGRRIKVVYRAAPSELSAGTDLFTASGLAETARVCVTYAAKSLLTADMDAARIPVGVAQADDLDPSVNGIGTAAKASAQLYQRYLMELENERRRLRLRAPITINKRTR